MLTLNNLHVRYGRISALQGISMEVKRGEIVALIGPNGAGKSTTLLAIAGAVVPASGEILFEGHSLVGRAPEAIARQRISLVPEGRHIFAGLTVEENLRLGATIRNDRTAIQRDIEAMLERFPSLKARLHMSGGKLSGGEQQQLAIARALMARPRLLLLDEPSLGLAPLIVDQVFEILEELHVEGITILLVEQYAASAIEIADRTYVLRNGKIELAGTREELLATTDLRVAYGIMWQGSARTSA